MNRIKQYFHNRKVRRLAERCLSGQILYKDLELQNEMVHYAIATAKAFYEQWRKRTLS